MWQYIGAVAGLAAARRLAQQDVAHQLQLRVDPAELRELVQLSGEEVGGQAF